MNGLPLRLAFVAMLAVFLPTSGARAQSQDLDLQLFLPTHGPGATFTIARTEVLRHLTYSLGLAANFSHGVLERSDDGQDIVEWRTQAEALAALGLFEWLEFGVAVPVSLVRLDEDIAATNLEPSTEFAAGDVRISAKVPIVRGDFSLSGRVVVSVPTGDGSRFAGQESWSGMPSVIAAYRTGPVTLTSELGYRFRERASIGNLEYDDELQWGLGGRVEVATQWAAILEGQLRAGLGGEHIRGNEVPVEIDGGMRFRSRRGLVVDFGLGTGVVSGYSVPDVRAFTIVRFVSEKEPCEAGPEDFDGYEDGDFCADLDNDGDHIEDAQDQCTNDPEDVDGFRDEDGCPDTDNDADGVADATDRCPLESEDRDGFQDDDGCPEPDNDEDGLADGVDQCPMDPEDKDHYQDEDGCPEPGPDQAVVTVTDSRILISERIYFDFDTDTIRSVSQPLLDQVAEVIRDLPARRRIRVEGYTDSDGIPAYNMDLSYRRARSVVTYLVAKGVPRNRFEYVGYGEKNPVAPNDSPEGQALNRRVEFTIIEPTDRRP